MADPVTATDAPPETQRQSALKSLASQLPVASQRIAQQQAAARNMQLQNAVAKAPVTAAPTTTAQQTGAGMAQQAGEQQVQQAQQVAQQGAQIGQIGIAEGARAGEAQVASAAAGEKAQEMDNLQRLNAIDQTAKQELYDKQMQFRKDEAGRTFMNEGQIMDYAKMKAQSDEQYKNYVERADQMHKMKISLMETAQKKLEQELQFEYSKSKQDQDQELTMQLEKANYAMKDKIKKDQNRIANKKGMAGAIGTGIGAIVGGIFGGGQGAEAGAKAGSGAGTAIGNY